MAIDVEWSLLELEKFIGLTVTDTRNTEVGRYRTRRGSQDDILAAAVVVEKICDRVISDWRTSIETRRRRVDRWDELVDAAKRTKVILERRAEVDEKLGEGAPQLDAARFHPWVWEGARSLWQSGHFRDAVRAASIKVNAETQNKIRRRNV